MKRLHRLTILSVLSCFIGIATLVPVWAAEPLAPAQGSDAAPASEPQSQSQSQVQVQAQPTPQPAPVPAISISRVQTSAQTASDEFIELTNTTDEPIEVTGWQLRYRNAASTIPGSIAIATIGVPSGASGEAAGMVVLQEREKYLLHTASVPLAAGERGQAYTARLSDADKVVGLFVPNHGDCTVEPTATFTIGAVQPALQPMALADCEQQPAPAPATALPQKPAILPQPIANADEGLQSDASPEAPSTGSGATGPAIPMRNNGLFAPQVSEVLPNPAKPGLDANDEFIELYNTNETTFELSGFMLEVGGKTKKRYTFAAGTLLGAKQFKAFYARDTNLTLANTAGQVWLLDPLGRQIASSEAYQNAKDGQSWLSANGKWQWTATPTPNALNALRPPTATTATSKSAGTKTTATAASAQGQGGTVRNASTADTPSQVASAAPESGDDQGGFNPLHPAILALTGVIAVSYGIYEYRRDLANKFHQFRANRAARRSARQAAPRR